MGDGRKQAGMKKQRQAGLERSQSGKLSGASIKFGDSEGEGVVREENGSRNLKFLDCENTNTLALLSEMRRRRRKGEREGE